MNIRKLDIVTCQRCGTVRPMAFAAREGWSIVSENDVQVGTVCRSCQTPAERAEAERVNAAEGGGALKPVPPGAEPLLALVHEEFVAAMGRVESGTDAVDRDALIRGIALAVAARVPHGDPIRNGMAGTAFLSALQEFARDVATGAVTA
jgi:hypothetical protein